MNRTKTITLTIGSMAAGAIIATGLTGVALAADTTPSPTSSSTTAPDAAGSATDGLRRGPGGPGGMRGDHGPGGELLHSESVVKAADGTITTEQRIRGTVTAVSASSITVKAEDGVSRTFVVSATTEVHTGLMTRGHGADDAGGTTTAAADTIADVKVDDVAMVEGTVSGSTATATRIHAMTAAEAAQMEQERATMEAERGQGGRGMAPHAHDAQGNDIAATGASATGTSTTSAA